MDLGCHAPEDFTQRYGDCLVRAVTTKEPVLNNDLFWISTVTETRISGFIVQNNVWTPAEYNLKDIHLDLSVPDLGLVNFKGRVVRVYRRAVKQYKQAYTYTNGVIQTEVIDYEHLTKDLRYSNQDIDFVKTVFNPMYMSLGRAIQEINTKRALSVAITSKYYISLSEYLPFIYLGTEEGAIGEINVEAEGCFLFPGTEKYVQDLENYINILGIKEVS